MDIRTIEFRLQRYPKPERVEELEEHYVQLVVDLNAFFLLNDKSFSVLYLGDLRRERVLRSHRSIGKHLAQLSQGSPTFFGCGVGVTYVDDRETGIQSHLVNLHYDDRHETKIAGGPVVSLAFEIHTPNFERSKTRIDEVFVEQARLLGATSGRYHALREQWARSPAWDPKDKVWSLADGLILRSSLIERIGESQLRALATHWVDYTVDHEKFAACVFNWSEQGTAVREVLEPHLGPERTDLVPIEDQNIPRLQ